MNYDGSTTSIKNKSFFVYIKPSFKNKQCLVYKGKGHEIPGGQKGEVLVYINEKTH